MYVQKYYNFQFYIMCEHFDFETFHNGNYIRNRYVKLRTLKATIYWQRISIVVNSWQGLTNDLTGTTDNNN